MKVGLQYSNLFISKILKAIESNIVKFYNYTYLCNDVLGIAGGGGFEDGVGLVRRYVVHAH